MTEQKKTLVDRIWDIFASVKTAIVLFGLIASTSIIGTIIEQNAEPEKNLMVLKRIVGEELAPTAYRVLDALGFMDMYHSWWFVTLLVLFALNLIVCSLERLPRVLKIMREPIKPLDSPEKRFPIMATVTVNARPEEIREDVLKAIRGMGFKPENRPLDRGGFQFYADKGAWSRLGVYITHLSILIIMVGAVIGIFLGFKGFLNLPEGFVSDVAYSRTGQPHKLGFSIKCEDFDVEFYGMSNAPKDYRSRLAVIKNGRVVMRKTIEVNDPLKFEGYTFYQSSYGMVPGAEGYAILKVTGPTGQTETVYKKVGETFVIPGTDIEGKITDFSPAIAFDNQGNPYTYSDMMNNPAIYVEFKEGGKEKYSGWILRRFPSTWQLPDGNRVEFIDYWGVQYTGLQVRKDPGVWIVYLGCIVMAFGLYVAFFMSHRKLWVFVTPSGKQTTIKVLGTANRNRASFQRSVERMLAHIQNT
jgi:cytochrome c biogenesis protein